MPPFSTQHPLHRATPHKTGHRSTSHTRSARGRTQSTLSWTHVSQKALVDFTRSFAVLVQARMPLIDALDAAARSCSSKTLQRMLQEVRTSVQRGQSLSQSLQQHPRAFDELYTQLTRVGETAGVLGDMLPRLATHLEKTAVLKRKVMLAMLYPGTILLVAIAATVFLLIAVVPSFADMFHDFGADLPALTQLVLTLSNGIAHHAALIFIGLVGVGVAATWAFRYPPTRYYWDRWKLKIPVFGTLIKNSMVARFCSTLATLLDSGLPLVEALSIGAQITNNRYVEPLLEDLCRRVQKGSSLYQPLERTGIFPSMVVQMIAVGEQTAELSHMLAHAARYFEQEVDAFVESLSALIEPVLIVLIGILLGALVAAMYLPIFNLVDVVG